MARRPDPIRVLHAQIAGTQQRLDDLELLIPRGYATNSQRLDAQQRLAHFQAKLAKSTGSQGSD